MNQIDIISIMINISKNRHNNQLSEIEAVEKLRQLIGDSSPDSNRWKVFEESRMMKTTISKLGKTHCRRIKELAVQIDPNYFNNVYWGDGI